MLFLFSRSAPSFSVHYTSNCRIIRKKIIIFVTACHWLRAARKALAPSECGEFQLVFSFPQHTWGQRWKQLKTNFPTLADATGIFSFRSGRIFGAGLVAKTAARLTWGHSYEIEVCCRCFMCSVFQVLVYLSCPVVTTSAQNPEVRRSCLQGDGKKIDRKMMLLSSFGTLTSVHVCFTLTTFSLSLSPAVQYFQLFFVAFF